MDLSILLKLAVPLIAILAAFVGILRAGVFAFWKLGKFTVPLSAVGIIISMMMLYPYMVMSSLFDQGVATNLFVTHICAGTIVCSIIYGWVNNLVTKDLERERQ